MSFLDLMYREVDAAGQQARSRGEAGPPGPAVRGLPECGPARGRAAGRVDPARGAAPTSRRRCRTSPGELCRGAAPAFSMPDCCVLAATPILRVVVMVGVYLRRRELFMAVVSIIVLGLLAVGVLMGSG